jgi:hypothetical protein
MSWDVLIVRLPQGTRRLEDLPTGYWPPSFEPTVELTARLRAIPNMEIVDDAWGVVRTPDYVVEIDLSTATRIHLQIEGAESSLETVRAITRALDAVAIDTTTGEAIDWAGDPSSGLRRSRERQELLDGVTDSSPSNDNTERRRRKGRLRS